MQGKATKQMAAVALKLLLICLVVAGLTALVFAVTKGPIEQGERARKEEAIRRIFPEAKSFTELSLEAEGVRAAYRVCDASGELLGYCVDYAGNSDYGGAVDMMIGVTPQRKIAGLQVISHAETFIDRYLDAGNLYTGTELPRGEDLSAGATLSYDAIRNAMEAVLALDFGGAA